VESLKKKKTLSSKIFYSYFNIVQSECCIYWIWRSHYMFYWVLVQKLYSKVLWYSDRICSAEHEGNKLKTVSISKLFIYFIFCLTFICWGL